MSKLLLEAIGTLDEKVMTKEVRNMIIEAFDKEVSLVAEAKAKDLHESIVVAMNENLDAITKSHAFDLEKSLNETANALAKEISDSHKKALDESYAKAFDDRVKLLTESVEQYLTQAIEEAVVEYAPVLKSEADVAQAKVILEVAAGFAKEFNVNLAEALNEKEGEDEDELTAAKKKAEELEAENKEMKKDKVIAESTAGMSDVQIVKFKSLVESIAFEDVESYKSKIATFKELVIAGPSKIVESVNTDGRKASWK